MQVAVFYLLWQPLGIEPVRTFAEAYGSCPAGVDHKLVVIANGFPDEAAAAPLLHPFGDLSAQVISMPEPCLDLNAYQYAASRIQADTYCFLNSYSRPLAPDWLRKLTAALSSPAVQMAGCSASWESLASRSVVEIDLAAQSQALQKRFPPFPNPHVRTTGFLMPAQTWRRLSIPPLEHKLDALAMESGNDSLTRQVQASGGEAVIVDRGGNVHKLSQAAASRTFRADGQDALLIEDNQTALWQHSSPLYREALALRAWRMPTTNELIDNVPAPWFLWMADRLKRPQLATNFLPVRWELSDSAPENERVVLEQYRSILDKAAVKVEVHVVDQPSRACACTLTGRRFELTPDAHGELPPAYRVLVHALEEIHRDEEQRRREVDALLARGDAKGAEQSLQALLQAFPDAPWIHLRLGDLLWDRGSHDRAARHYQCVCEEDAGYSRQTLRLAQWNLRQRRPSAARRLLRQLLKRKPFLLQGWWLMVRAAF
ncbi:MAG: tetratricopeptide repeat protein [Candidatus Xenobia bacterium]